jgi:hypothetical protein
MRHFVHQPLRVPKEVAQTAGLLEDAARVTLTTSTRSSDMSIKSKIIDILR